MEYLDSGKYSISRVDDAYVLVSIYTDDEITADDVPPVLEFFSQFEEPVPVLLHRDGNYSLTFEAQLALIEHAPRLIRKLAFLDTTPVHKRLTKLANETYLKAIGVKSFKTHEAAEEWLRSFGGI